MIQISKTEVKLPDEKLLFDLRDEFADKHCLLLPKFIEPSLLSYLIQNLSSVHFDTKLEMNNDDEFGKVLFVPLNEPILFVFNLLLNNQKLFNVIEQITKCEKIGNFFGRIHCSEANSNQQISWHGDNADNRLLGITVNLSTEKYKGGFFQLREKVSEKHLCEIGQTQAGDAFIFRIAPNLQHCLTVVESGGRRTVGVGWFRSKPDQETFSKEYFRF